MTRPAREVTSDEISARADAVFAPRGVRYGHPLRHPATRTNDSLGRGSWPRMWRECWDMQTRVTRLPSTAKGVAKRDTLPRAGNRKSPSSLNATCTGSSCGRIPTSAMLILPTQGYGRTAYPKAGDKVSRGTPDEVSQGLAHNYTPDEACGRCWRCSSSRWCRVWWCRCGVHWGACGVFCRNSGIFCRAISRSDHTLHSSSRSNVSTARRRSPPLSPPNLFLPQAPLTSIP